MVDLFQRHRDRLRRMIELRNDGRLQSRLDSSGVLQEVFLNVASRLDDSLRDPKLPLFLWLRLCVGAELVNLHRRHLGTRQRDAAREVALDRGAMPEASSAALASVAAGLGVQPRRDGRDEPIVLVESAEAAMAARAL
jgi:RNA polymerase sigma-70 factor (ECF subfamily)